MFNAQIIGPGPSALMASLQSNIQTMLQSVSLKEARGYVFALSGTMDLGRVQPANIAIIAGGNVEELRLIYRELGRTLAQADEAERVEHARAELAEKLRGEPPFFGYNQPGPSYDDYLREEEAETSVEEPKGPLETLAERMGFRIVQNPTDGGPTLRCADYPNCGCGPVGRAG